MNFIRHNWQIVVIAAFLSTIIAGSMVYGGEIFQWSREQILALQAISDRHPMLFGAGLIALYAVLATVFVPCDFILMPAAGAFFGVWGGIVVASLANAIGPTGAFLVARHLLRRRTMERYADQVARVDKGIERDGWLYMVILRIAPILPAPLVNIAAGMTCLPLWKYVSATVIGKIPLTFLYLLIGDQLAEIQSASDVITPQMLGALLGLAAFLLISRRVYVKYGSKDGKPHTA